MSILTWRDHSFYLDGEPFVIYSGAMHYFRIPREYWRDRLLKLRECGLNTLETYICWNLHEKQEGVFDFSGILDVAAYIRLAGELGLQVIIRPGPYICAEWDFGGLPAWLLKYEKMPIRCNDTLYLEKIRRYYEALFAQIRPLLSTNGGPVQMVQIENEYGSYGNDHTYMQTVADLYREMGVDCLLFTADGAEELMLAGGTLPQYLAAANFGSDPAKNFDYLKKVRPNEPTMCGEYWCGWFDHWYGEHHVRPDDEKLQPLLDMLEKDQSFSCYMFHGGTNFGWMNGANFTDHYMPTITSYDYNAFLSEAGDRTPAYWKLRDAIAAKTGVEVPVTATESAKAAYGPVTLTGAVSVLDAASHLGKPQAFPAPVWQEELGQNHGFTLYSTTVRGPMTDVPMSFDELHDRAAIFVDGVYQGYAERSRKDPDVRLTIPAGEALRVDILVENMGRVNYGPKLRDRKGVIGVRFGFQYHFGWEITALTLPQYNDANTLPAIPFGDAANTFTGSRFLRGELTVDVPADTFLRPDGLHHGCVWVNGFHLGRYYNDAGPQKTLYCPGVLLREGANEVVVLECDGADGACVVSVAEPELG